MIKKLDILIVKAFIGPFIATFFITLFVLILQFFWLWIDDFVGKGVDGLVDPGAFTPIPDISTDTANSVDANVATRVGMLFNWVPVRTVFVSDPRASRLQPSPRSATPRRSRST